MSVVQSTPDLRDHLALQVESLKVIALFTGIIGYIWLILVVWPVTGSDAPPAAWIGGLSLMLSVCLSYALKERLQPLAFHLLIWGMLIAITCATLTFHRAELAYLFILPVIFASVLLSQRTVFLVAGTASFLIAAVGMAHLSLPPLSIEVSLPILVIILTTIASWLSAHNLYTALAWVMFKELPNEIEEAALVDGCTPFGAFFRVALPLAAPAVAATFILCLSFAWNELLFALILGQKDAITLPVFIAGSQQSRGVAFWFAATRALIAALPPTTLALFIQPFIVRGLTFGAIKG